MKLARRQWLGHYGRSLKGSRGYGDAPTRRGNNLTVIGAMALKELIGEMTLPGATDGLVFKTDVTQVLVPNRMASSDARVMDNLPDHKVAGIR